MRIVVAGGSGFIGEPLVRRLVARGDDVAVLTRNPAKVRAGRAVAWDPHADGGDWRREVGQAGAVINLAGENIGEGRWTAARKERLIDSRIASTRALVAAMRANRATSRTFVSTSAVGFYGDRGDELLDEQASGGTGFLADLTRQWEAAAREADDIARVASAIREGQFDSEFEQL